MEKGEIGIVPISSTYPNGRENPKKRRKAVRTNFMIIVVLLITGNTFIVAMETQSYVALTIGMVVLGVCSWYFMWFGTGLVAGPRRISPHASYLLLEQVAMSDGYYILVLQDKVDSDAVFCVRTKNSLPQNTHYVIREKGEFMTIDPPTNIGEFTDTGGFMV